MKKLLVIGIAFSASISAALAMQGPKISFDATYESQTPAGTSTLRMMSDGKGHVRTETQSGSQKITSIVDYGSEKATTLMETPAKMAMETHIKEQPSVHDEESAKKLNAKDLGKKMVDGHMSHGYEYSSPNGKSVVWVGEDTHYMVRSEVTPQGQTKPSVITSLKSWSSKAPSEDAFKIPAGYKMVQLPMGGQGGGYPGGAH